jgi:hypothetical protein
VDPGHRSEAQAHDRHDDDDGGAGEQEEFKVLKGTGRVSSSGALDYRIDVDYPWLYLIMVRDDDFMCSGTIVHGHGSRFMAELAPGDAVLIGESASLSVSQYLCRYPYVNICVIL